MKKLFGIAAIFLCFICSANMVSGQIAFSKPPVFPLPPGFETASDPNGFSVVPNAKTISRFSREFARASDVSWTALKDHVMMCRFRLDQSIHRAFYTGKGKLMFTEFGYPAERLDKTLYDRVKSVYYNASIGYTNEIDRPGEAVIYIIELRDDNTICKLRVEGDDMQIIKQFQVLK